MATEEVPCPCCLFYDTILHHFCEAPSRFLKSVTVLSEDITANHRPKGAVLLVTFCQLFQAIPCLHTQYTGGKSLYLPPPLGSRASIPTTFSCYFFSQTKLWRKQCFFRDLYLQLSGVSLVFLWLGGKCPLLSGPCLSLVLSNQSHKLNHTSQSRDKDAS